MSTYVRSSIGWLLLGKFFEPWINFELHCKVHYLLQSFQMYHVNQQYSSCKNVYIENQSTTKSVALISWLHVKLDYLNLHCFQKVLVKKDNV